MLRQLFLTLSTAFSIFGLNYLIFEDARKAMVWSVMEVMTFCVVWLLGAAFIHCILAIKGDFVEKRNLLDQN